MIHWLRRPASSTSAPPLVLLHGFTGTTASWQWTVEELAAPTAAAAIALPGHHPHAPVADGFAANVDAIARTITQDGLSGCHLVGYSLGARTALGIAIQHPGLASTLTLIGAHPGLETQQDRQRRIDADSRWVALLETKGMDAFVAQWESQPLFASQRHLPPERQRAQSMQRRSHHPAHLAASLIHMGLGAMPNYGRHLDSITLPTLCVAGENDIKFAALAGQIASQLPRASLRLIPTCGHNCLLERPDHLARILSEVLT